MQKGNLRLFQAFKFIFCWQQLQLTFSLFSYGIPKSICSSLSSPFMLLFRAIAAVLLSQSLVPRPIRHQFKADSVLLMLWHTYQY